MHTLNQETVDHCKRVSILAYQTAVACGFSNKMCNEIWLAGFLHDIGKQGIPLEILEKPGKLTDEEYKLIKTHPPLGADILAKITSKSIIEMVLYHHENENGTGYYSLSKDKIPAGAKIIHICDVFDAMTNKRCYKQSMDQKEVLKWMSSQGGSFYPDNKII